MICVNRDREHLVEDHLEIVRFEVAALAKRADVGYLVKRLGRDEAEGVGNVALCEAANTFDFQRGVTFSTYAGAAIRRAILTAAQEFTGQTVNVELEIESHDRLRDDRLAFLQAELPNLSALENAVAQLWFMQELPQAEVCRKLKISQPHASAVANRVVRKLTERAERV